MISYLTWKKDEARLRAKQFERQQEELKRENKQSKRLLKEYVRTMQHNGGCRGLNMEGDLVLKMVSYSHTIDKLSPKWVRPCRVYRVVDKEACKLETLDGRRVPYMRNVSYFHFIVVDQL